MSEPGRTALATGRGRSAFALAAALLTGALLAPGPSGAVAADPTEGFRLHVADWVRERAPWPVMRVEFPPLDGWSLESGGEPVQVALATHPEQRLLGAVPIFVVASQAGQVLREATLTLHVFAEVPVLVAARNLRSGRTLASEDVAIEMRDAGEVGDAWLDHPDAAVGRRATRPVRAGMALRPSWFEDEPRVRRGQRLRLRLFRGGLRIETTGRAREEGDVGEWIRVQNLTSRREVLARISEDGVAHVAY